LNIFDDPTRRAADIDRVHEMFPHLTRELIAAEVSDPFVCVFLFFCMLTVILQLMRTAAVEVTIADILEGRVAIPEADPNPAPLRPTEPVSLVNDNNLEPVESTAVQLDSVVDIPPAERRELLLAAALRRRTPNLGNNEQ
jgi:hypothetical protein